MTNISGRNWRKALICGRNRGVKRTELKKEQYRGYSFGLNWRIAVKEGAIIKGFYCISLISMTVFLRYVFFNLKKKKYRLAT